MTSVVASASLSPSPVLQRTQSSPKQQQPTTTPLNNSDDIPTMTSATTTANPPSAAAAIAPFTTTTFVVTSMPVVRESPVQRMLLASLAQTSYGKTARNTVLIKQQNNNLNHNNSNVSNSPATSSVRVFPSSNGRNLDAESSGGSTGMNGTVLPPILEVGETLHTSSIVSTRRFFGCKTTGSCQQQTLTSGVTPGGGVGMVSPGSTASTTRRSESPSNHQHSRSPGQRAASVTFLEPRGGGGGGEKNSSSTSPTPINASVIGGGGGSSRGGSHLTPSTATLGTSGCSLRSILSETTSLMKLPRVNALKTTRARNNNKIRPAPPSGGSPRVVSPTSSGSGSPQQQTGTGTTSPATSGGRTPPTSKKAANNTPSSESAAVTSPRRPSKQLVSWITVDEAIDNIQQEACTTTSGGTTMGRIGSCLLYTSPSPRDS
eukprot:TRINITY_DN27627_c0_g1_i2.p1 TRINITY_DN27627_c0_g1~~TRINITY_DN27627_c0_g1_i2.p1  ORF type:complete len:432 (+),score=80.30 TRINITY_DN27627_c0_g1_i2:110-1405(+)